MTKQLAVGDEQGVVAFAGQLLRCAGRVVRLLWARRLHIDSTWMTSAARLPDGREFSVFRQTTCDGEVPGGDVTLAVWFHLRYLPPGARFRRWLFERESILNTILYAGAPGYRIKLWMVDPATCDYAGLYAWHGAEAAERYGRYICTILRPLSEPGSVGFELIGDRTLADYVASPAAS
jgi:hypothetical protein